jgi:hypothetical protein
MRLFQKFIYKILFSKYNSKEINTSKEIKKNNYKRNFKIGEEFNIHEDARALCGSKIGGLPLKGLEYRDPFILVEVTFTGNTFLIYNDF